MVRNKLPLLERFKLWLKNHSENRSKKQEQDKYINLWMDKSLSQLEKYQLLDKMVSQRDPTSGKKCPICGVVSFSSFIVKEVGEPCKSGYAPVFQKYVLTNCGHDDESHKPMSTHSIYVG